MQPISPFEWIQHYYVLEYAITITLSIFLISMILLTLKAVQGALFTKARRTQSCDIKKDKADNEADLHNTIKEVVEEILRIKEFDTAMVLMEQQNLKKLEIEELRLRLELHSHETSNPVPAENKEQPL
ncbi:hypothetical protein [Sulfuricurvum sp.]|uniref:hypothetical protein n=1 Tax=Sulfuricurvum sp. TaxID=2025608 RepID=UPI003565A49C